MFAQSQNGREERPPTVIDAGQPGQGRVSELLEVGPQERPDVADRVAYLFPRPETTDWNVRELSYDRRRRAEPQPEHRAS